LWTSACKEGKEQPTSDAMLAVFNDVLIPMNDFHVTAETSVCKSNGRCFLLNMFIESMMIRELVVCVEEKTRLQAQLSYN